MTAKIKQIIEPIKGLRASQVIGAVLAGPKPKPKKKKRVRKKA